MKFTTTDVKDLMLYGERINIEYKEAASDLPKSLWETYSAFANAIWNGDSISSIELQQLLGLNSIEVGKILHQMVDKQLLNKENKNRWTTYTLLKEDSADFAGEEKSDVIDNEEGGQKTAISSEKTIKVSETSSGTQTKSSGTRQKTTEKILEYIKDNPQITIPQIAVELGLSTRGVEKSLRQLKKTGIIKRVGSPTFGGYWEIIQQ